MQRRLFAAGMIALLALILAGACAPRGPDAARESAPPAAGTAAPTAQGWEREWQNVTAAARKEGKIVVYSSSGYGPRDALAPGFTEKFGIPIDWVTARSAELSPKIATERRAGLFIPDVYQGGSPSIVQDLKPRGFLDPTGPILFLPEVTDASLWVNSGINFVDKDRMIVSYAATTSTPLAYNTDLVQAGEIKSYKDLLSPKWKGKLMLNDPTLNGPGADWYGVVREMLGLDFMRQLVMQEPSIAVDHRLQTEWLARGKYPMLIAPNDAMVTEFKKVGAPVKGLVPVEGTSLKSGSGSIALMNGAPHPNAARLYINWLLTREAQIILQRTQGEQSARLDVPTDTLDPEKVRQGGVKYVYTGSEEYLLNRVALMKEAKEIFGSLMK
ncbi:MAG: extracellular solute-binding protein [Chloroflexi bacterium]|nr:extracellular solute-binding protein [Chloroflexota bacterium]